MRLSEILNESPNEINSDTIENIIKTIFGNKYPDRQIFAKEEDGITSAVTNQEAEDATDPEYGDPDVNLDNLGIFNGSQFFDPSPSEFSLTMNAYQDEEGMNVIITDANSGPFKGVVAPIIAQVFKLASNAPRNLIIKHDSSGGAWEAIAKKVGAELQDDRYY